MLSGSLTVMLTWTGIAIVPPLLGYLLGKMAKGWLRIGLLLLLILAPILFLTFLLLMSAPTPQGYFVWFAAGLIMISPVILLWGVLAGVSFMVSRSRVR